MVSSVCEALRLSSRVARTLLSASMAELRRARSAVEGGRGGEAAGVGRRLGSARVDEGSGRAYGWCVCVGRQTGEGKEGEQASASPPPAGDARHLSSPSFPWPCVAWAVQI